MRLIITILAAKYAVMYIHEKENWTSFYWNQEEISSFLDEVCREQGKLYGRLESIGFENQLMLTAENIVSDIVYSSEIEGVVLNTEEVRSSVATKLGIDTKSFVAPSHRVDSVVEVTLDALHNYERALTKDRLCGWQAALFPTGYSSGVPIETGRYRTCEEHIVSGRFGHEKVHYVAPSPDRVEVEMEAFLQWFNANLSQSPIIRSAIAHLWFVSIHPFEDGNGRLSRIIADIFLARGDKSRMRFYNMSSQINQSKKEYYCILETVQRGNGDITQWLVWYISTLKQALLHSDILLSRVLCKSLFWAYFAQTPMTQRQKEMLNLFLDGYEAKITSKNWAGLAKCSSDTALRDIQDLVDKQVLLVDDETVRRKSYSINYTGKKKDAFLARFSHIEVVTEGERTFIRACTDGTKEVSECLMSLDVERLKKGEVQPEQLLAKYFSYL